MPADAVRALLAAQPKPALNPNPTSPYLPPSSKATKTRSCFTSKPRSHSLSEPTILRPALRLGASARAHGMWGGGVDCKTTVRGGCVAAQIDLNVDFLGGYLSDFYINLGCINIELTKDNCSPRTQDIDNCLVYKPFPALNHQEPIAADTNNGPVRRELQQLGLMSSQHPCR